MSEVEKLVLMVGERGVLGRDELKDRIYFKDLFGVLVFLG